MTLSDAFSQGQRAGRNIERALVVKFLRSIASTMWWSEFTMSRQEMEDLANEIERGDHRKENVP